MATGLESQLIRGAGQAVAKDPYGLVQRAQDAAATKITSGLMTIGTIILLTITMIVMAVAYVMLTKDDWRL